MPSQARALKEPDLGLPAVPFPGYVAEGNLPAFPEPPLIICENPLAVSLGGQYAHAWQARAWDTRRLVIGVSKGRTRMFWPNYR